MQITLIAVGKRMPDWVNQGFNDYAKRMPAECRLNLIEIPSQKRLPSSNLNKLIEQEGKQILIAAPAQSHIIALERTGKPIDTNLFAQNLQKWYNDQQNVVFFQLD